MCRLYFFSDFENLSKQNLDEYICKMPKDRIEKFNKYLSIQNKLNCFVSYFLLWFSLKQNNIIKTAPSIFYGSNFKPYLLENKQTFFNISHTTDGVICAISKTEVGVDIEKIRPRNLNISKKICTPSEYKFFEKSSNKLEFLLNLWTKKESYVKMKAGNIFSSYFKINTLNLLNIDCFKYKNFIISVSLKEKKFVKFTEVFTENILNML